MVTKNSVTVAGTSWTRRRLRPFVITWLSAPTHTPPPPNFVRKADPNLVEAAIAALPINEFIAAQMDLNGRGDISDIIGNMSRVDSFTPDPKFITKVDFGESVPIGDHAEVIITGGGICLVRRRPRTGQLTAIWPDSAYDFRVQNGHLNPVWFDME